MIYLTLPAVALGFFIDLLIGDPRWLYHPVCIIGKGISAGEKLLRGIFPKTKAGERAAGCVLAAAVTVLSAAVPAVILLILYHLSWIAGFAVETFFCYQLLATKSLKQESGKVYKELKEGTLESSRKAVSMIVGRDTAALDEKGVTKAAVETVAENASDGVIAPLFYMMIGGAVWGFAYKAINTMDSMIGYKNEKYQYFGTAAARLDDGANFIPARISGLLMILASFLCGMNGRNAAAVYRRDRKKHASPNAAQTESVMAGALDIQLAGDAWYFGTLHKKPFIGDSNRPVEPEDIPRSHKILYATAILALVVFGTVRFLVIWSFFV
ncbi:MAG TPA: adenosylcobinamide-phosphate synthase CbiB [Candidatus Eubacterium avistercoris]|uniref:Cobalamin biosynthesis protein CobD n=1 Tax=Candidatus Eubacterium avistercoris TaxID=2838567 RepID=A0A9D2IH12_9FIRM|nr:adenosylcobinamide-phosphate synthase CbiB [Candidatus Eubacterium avistercoris]